MKSITPKKIEEVNKKKEPKSRMQVFQEAFGDVMQVLAKHPISISDMYVIGQRLQHQAFEQGMINAQAYVDKKISEAKNDTSSIQSTKTTGTTGKVEDNTNTSE